MRTIRNITIAILAVGLLAGSAVAVSAQDGEAGDDPLDGLEVFGEKVSTSFTGRFTSQSDVIEEGTEVVVDGLLHLEGIVLRQSMVSSDPRLTGAVTTTADWVIDVGRPDGMATIMFAGTLELTNGGGSWLGEFVGVGDLEHEMNDSVVTFAGRGGYEGLTAVAVIDTWDWAQTYEGTIFPAAMPEIPEPYVAE